MFRFIQLVKPIPPLPWPYSWMKLFSAAGKKSLMLTFLFIEMYVRSKNEPSWNANEVFKSSLKAIESGSFLSFFCLLFGLTLNDKEYSV